MMEKIIRIAYADDHVLVRKGIISFLNGLGGMSVDIEADNGKELLDKIEKANDLPDVCLLDINMPDMNGFETIVKLKERWPQMKVLVFTVFELDVYIIRMVAYGANGYLLKSSGPDEIKKAISVVYRDGMYFSDAISRQNYHEMQTTQKFPVLTVKEEQLLKYSCTDLSYAQIAEQVGVSFKSIEGVKERLFQKLNITNRVSLAMYAVQTGAVTIEMNTSDQQKKTIKKLKKNN